MEMFAIEDGRRLIAEKGGTVMIMVERTFLQVPVKREKLESKTYSQHRQTYRVLEVRSTPT